MKLYREGEISHTILSHTHRHINIIVVLAVQNSIIFRSNMSFYKHIYRLYEIYLFSENVFAAHF